MEEQKTVVTESNQTPSGATVERESVATTQKQPGSVIARRVVWFIAGLIIILLAARVVLLLLAANPDNDFVAFIYAISAPFAAPFYGMFNYQPSFRTATLEVSSLVAMGVYALIAWGIDRLITLVRPRQTTV